MHIKKYLILFCVLTGFLLPRNGFPEMRPANAHLPIEGVESVQVEVTSSENIISLNYQVPTANITTLEDGFRCIDDVCYDTRVRTGNAKVYKGVGKPIVPKVLAIIIIPPNKEIESINIERDGINEFEGDYLIEFGENLQQLCGIDDPIEETEPDPLIYNSDNPYPSETYKLLNVQKKCGVYIAYINIYPLSYYPLSGRIVSYNLISLEINLKDVSYPPEELPCRPERVNPLTMGIENPEALDLYSCLSPPEICNPSERYDWVMITSQPMIDAPYSPTVYDLKAHREDQGLTAKIVTIEEIKSDPLYDYPDHAGGQPADNAVKVRNFIRHAYKNWDTKYVLLGGDENVIPCRALYVKVEQMFHVIIANIPSDLYYQCLDGPYNFYEDDKWGRSNDGKDNGEVDLEAEVYIGRACAGAGDVSEMSNFIYKTLKYENSPDYSPHLREVHMFGEYLGFGGPSDYAKPSMNDIYLGSSEHGYTTKGFANHVDYAVRHLYEMDRDWSRSDVKAKVEENNYHIFNHLGHSNWNIVIKCDRDYVKTWGNENLLFCYSQGCNAGDIEQSCVAEYLTTETRNCLFSGVFNSRSGWGAANSTDGPNQRFNREFWDAHIREGMYSLGEINADSHEDNIDIVSIDKNWGQCVRWAYFGTNLFGDPYTPIIEYIPCVRNIWVGSAPLTVGGIGKAHNEIQCHPHSHPPNFYGPTKDLTFISGRTIHIRNSFRVNYGIEFKAKIDPSLYLLECEE